MLILAGLLARFRDRRGFTLIETLIAMVTGVIVTGALFAILEVSVRQSAHLSSEAQATQISEAAMTKVVDKLRSACLSNQFTPVIEKSTENKLVFVNGYDERPAKKTEAEAAKEPPAELPASGIHKDVIEYEPKTERLVDTTYVATSSTPVETAEKFTFSSTPSQKYRLAEKVTQVEENGKKLPVFEYFAYNTSSSTGLEKAASTLKEETLITSAEPELSTANAATVASVVVRFRTAPYTKEGRFTANEEKSLSADQTSQTIFTLGSPNSESTIKAGPCE
jgi:type II secretory pathway pseudopilin PulG